MAVKGKVYTIKLLAWDTANNVGKTGDAANLSLFVQLDAGDEAAATNTPVEIDATNLPGVYRLTLTAAEMAGADIVVGGISATPNVVVYPRFMMTDTGIMEFIQAATDGDAARVNNVLTYDDSSGNPKTIHTITDAARTVSHP